MTQYQANHYASPKKSRKNKKNIGAEQNLLTNFYCNFFDLYAHCLNQEEFALNLTQISKVGLHKASRLVMAVTNHFMKKLKQKSLQKTHL